MTALNETEFFNRLDKHVADAGCNTNPVYSLIMSKQLSLPELQAFCDNYFYYIRTFPQILTGLAHRVDSEEVRLELVKTVVSELGDGHPGKMHFQLFENVIEPLGLSVKNWKQAKHVPEADELVAGIRKMYLEGPPFAAVGGHYVIEQTGMPMIKSLYEGFRLYPQSSIASLEYFYLHLIVESHHVAWIKEAVRTSFTNPQFIEQVDQGARQMAHMLSRFWNGIHRAMVEAGRGREARAATA